MKLPRFIYESLPFVYIALGVAILLFSDSPIVFISSLLFLAAGVLVFSWRHAYRRGRMPSDDAAPHKNEP